MGVEGVIPLEQAKKRDHKIMITNVAIDKVPLVNVPEFSHEQNLALWQAHREILSIAKERNDSNEVLGIWRNDFSRKIIVMGNEFAVDPSGSVEARIMFSVVKRNQILYLHNHPSTNKFSLADILDFIRYGQIGLISVVTNQGEIYLLNKGSKYDYYNAKNLFSEIYSNFDRKFLSHDEAVREFLKNCNMGGINYERST